MTPPSPSCASTASRRGSRPARAPTHRQPGRRRRGAARTDGSVTASSTATANGTMVRTRADSRACALAVQPLGSLVGPGDQDVGDALDRAGRWARRGRRTWRGRARPARSVSTDRRRRRGTRRRATRPRRTAWTTSGNGTRPVARRGVGVGDRGGQRSAGTHRAADPLAPRGDLELVQRPGSAAASGATAARGDGRARPSSAGDGRRGGTRPSRAAARASSTTPANGDGDREQRRRAHARILVSWPTTREASAIGSQAEAVAVDHHLADLDHPAGAVVVAGHVDDDVDRAGEVLAHRGRAATPARPG